MGIVMLPPRPPSGRLFRRAQDLTAAELVQLASRVQTLLYGSDAAENPYPFDSEKEWDGGDICEALGRVLESMGMVPPDEGPIHEYTFRFNWPGCTHEVAADGCIAVRAAVKAKRGLLESSRAFPTGVIPEPSLIRKNGIDVDSEFEWPRAFHDRFEVEGSGGVLD